MASNSGGIMYEDHNQVNITNYQESMDTKLEGTLKSQKKIERKRETKGNRDLGSPA